MAVSLVVPNPASCSLAILIDGDNAQPSLIERVMAEASKYGTLAIRRIYGDWTTQQMSGWKAYLHSYAIRPIQQFHFTKGKNSTDGALIIDAMDILHSGGVQGFCIVSSDSDYTGLAVRIRESGMLVVGMGKKTTPKSFTSACNIFTYVENLQQEEDGGPAGRGPGTPSETEPAAQKSSETEPPDWRGMVEDAVSMSQQEDDWVLLADVGNNLRKIDPAFDSRTYGFKKLSLLIQSDEDVFEVQERAGVPYVRSASR